MRSSSPVRKFLPGCLVLTSLIVLAAGCGGSSGRVSGKVLYKGKPLPGGSVRFFPEGQGGNFYSEIESDGSYSISKLPRGQAKISVIYSSGDPLAKMNPRQAAGAAKGMKKQQEMAAKKGKGGAGAAAAEDINVPEKYSDPQKSGLKVDVAGGAQTFDIKID